MRYRYLIALFALAAVGVYLWSPSNGIRLAAQMYTAPSDGFQIRPPEGWHVDMSGQSGTLVVFINTTADREGNFELPANINVLVDPIQGMSWDAYVAATKENLPQYLTNYQDTEDRAATINGRQAHVVGGTFDGDRGHRLRNRQALVLDDKQVYIITATALESAWGERNQILDASVKTFTIQNE